MKHLAIFALALLISPLATAQSALAFEVASVRPSNPERIGYGLNGGPGTANPGRLDYLNTPLRTIIQTAYGIPAYELIAPSWMTAYDLTVGKSGSKLKESDLSLTSEAQPSGPMKPDAAGFPILFRGRSMVRRYSTGPGTFRMAGGLQTTDQIAQILTNYVGARVSNKTNLTGKYDFHLEFLGDDSSDGAGALVLPPDNSSEPVPSIFSAVQEQLGLRLERTKTSFDVLVIDNAEKTPSQN